jgi:hypothetical protein
MSWQNLLSVMLLTLAYGGIIAGLVWLLRRAGAPARWAVLLGFLTFGAASGLLAAWAWPYDSCVLPNLWAALLGDALYGLSSEHLGDLAIFRVPWVYPIVGAVLYGALGLGVQALVNWQRGLRAGPAAESDGQSMQA